MSGKRSTLGPRKIIVGVSALLAVLFVVASGSSLYEENQLGYVKIRQMPVTGSLHVQTDPGVFAQWFGSVWEYKVAGTYRFGDGASIDGGNDRGHASIASQAVEVRFSDAGKAHVSGNTRFDLPTQHDKLLLIHEKFRSYNALVKGLIQPQVAESLITAGNLMTAEESYSGRRAEFAQIARDQLENGIYLTDYDEEEVVNEETGEVSKRRIVTIRRDGQGNPVRKPNPLNDYGINITQFILDKDLEYESGVLAQIQAQRDARMKAVSAKAEAEKAAQDALTAEAKGKARVVTAQYEEEEKKIRQLVLGQQKLEVAQLARQEAEEYKKQQVLIGQGDAERKRLVMQADGALAQKLEAYVAAQQVWAQAYANRKVPTTVFGGSNANDGVGGTDMSAANFMNLIMMRTAQELSVNPTPGKKKP